ncbi:MAG: hypothetical protein WKG07_11915 [Hymenobacter sp.]
MAKDSVKRRIGGAEATAPAPERRSEGISYTEFSYQLLQGYDFVHLQQNAGLHSANGRQRPVGQHHHRHRAHPPPRRRATRPKPTPSPASSSPRPTAPSTANRKPAPCGSTRP